MADTNTNITLSSGQSTVKDVAEFGAGKGGAAKRWKAEIQSARQAREDWMKRAEKVVRRYEDKRSATEETERKFNILWSNVQVMKPAVYAKPPQPEVNRKYDTTSDAARVGAMILERNLDYFVCEHSIYDRVMNACVLDRLLPGQGTAWVRYSANLPPPPQPHNEPAPDASTAEYAAHEATETPAVEAGEHANVQITDDEYVGATEEEVCYDYVHWKDFLCTVARTWEEVTWVGRRVYMTQARGIKRFGEIFKKVPLNYKNAEKQKGESGNKEFGPGAGVFDKAAIWEIWDKDTKTVVWMCEDYDETLDEKRDILELEDFFPCPKPLLSTTTTDSIIPVPDYCMYQDQASELDLCTNRISMLMQALKVIGVYDKTQDALQRLLSEGTDNVMIPADNWAMFAERGGLKGTVDFFPVQMVAEVLTQLIQDRNVLKQDIYEITGLADIIRGSNVASETATATSTKEKFAGIRISDTQKDIARFAGDLLNMSAQIMVNFFQPETLVINADIEPTDTDFAFVQSAIALIKSKKLIKHRLTVSVDAITEQDQEKEQTARVEFLTALGQFFQQASAAVAEHPELATMMGHIVLWGVRGFKVGRDLEGVLEQGIKAISTAPAPGKPTPEQQKMQQEQEAHQQDLQQAQEKHQQDIQEAGLRIQEKEAATQAKNTEDTLKLQLMQRESDQKMALAEKESAMRLSVMEQELVLKQKAAGVSTGIQVQSHQTDQALAKDAHAQEQNMAAEQHALDVTSQALGAGQSADQHAQAMNQGAASHAQSMGQAQEQHEQGLQQGEQSMEQQAAAAAAKTQGEQ